MTERCATQGCGGTDLGRLVLSMRPTQGKDRRSVEHDFGVRCGECQQRLIAAIGEHNSKVRELVATGVHPRLAARRVLSNPPKAGR